MEYSWPGNVRELRNGIERIAILENDDVILPHHLTPEIQGEKAAQPSSPFDIGALYPNSLAEVERAYMSAVLGRVGGNKTKAAEILGITRQTLRARLSLPE